MFFKQPDLTSGSRPILLQDETLLFVQNGVGLYEGKYKIGDCQNGHAYLTSHRACYIDDTDSRKNSLAIDLKDVERYEYQAGFLKSSPKVTFHSKALRRGFGSMRQPASPISSNLSRLQSSSSPGSRSGSPFRAPVPVATPPASTGSWICPICTFNNPVPSNFDATTVTEAFPLPSCLTCGVKPPFAVVLKAAISANASHSVGAAAQSVGLAPNSHVQPFPRNSAAQDVNICPRCTFHNHPSLRVCEICGAALPQQEASGPNHVTENGRTASPAPEIAHLSLKESDEPTSMKFSFRQGGDKVFHERLKNAMIQRKWLVTNAPPIPKPLDNVRTNDGTPAVGSASESPKASRPTGVGIAGLEQRGLQSRKTNEAVLGTAFEDLEALMASAKEIVALAEKFASESRSSIGDTSLDPVLSRSAAALGMVATKDMMGDGSNTLYISELARNLAEYVSDERIGLLRKHGGAINLVDFWATFNRSRDGLELVSPADFHKAAELWGKLSLPVRLRRFRSGVLVVQRHDWSDDKTIAQLKQWLSSLQNSPPETPQWDWASYGCGVSAHDAVQRFGWSLGVATEELEMAEERGALCREEGIEGLKFWLNYFDET